MTGYILGLRLTKAEYKNHNTTLYCTVPVACKLPSGQGYVIQQQKIRLGPVKAVFKTDQNLSNGKNFLFIFSLISSKAETAALKFRPSPGTLEQFSGPGPGP